jgi:PIN domain
MGEVVHVFLDTNTALHFSRADQIDWQDLTGTPQVVLVVAPVLLRELEREKVHNPSRKLRERADNAVKWLATFLRDASPPPVRPGVTLKFLGTEPQVDFGAQRLSPSIADDQLIASVLEYQAGTHELVTVSTADVGLEAKLRIRRIEPLLLPEKFKLPAEPDPLEEKLRQTQRKLQRLESRLPDVRLAFENQTDRLELSLKAGRDPLDAPTLSEIQNRHAPLMKLRNFGLSNERIDNYNKELSEFYSAYAAYLEKLAEWEDQEARTFKVELVLSNRGSAPASHIDAVLDFPDDLEIMEIEMLPERPRPPKPPVRPSAFGLSEISEALSRYEDRFSRDPLSTLHGIALNPFDGAPVVEQHQVKFSLNRLKHGFDEWLQTLYFRFPDRSASRSFSIDFQLSAAELPDATSGKLHIVVSTG